MTVISITYAPIAPLMMGFATLGLCLYYLAYRYNLLFVNATTIDTKGYVYAKALQHTLVGCYLAAICLIGLLAIRAAVAPLVLMIIFLIAMVLYHISLNSAMKPLLLYLPRSLEAEEQALLNSHDRLLDRDGAYGDNTGVPHGVQSNTFAKKTFTDKGTPTPKKVSFLKKFFRPDVYCNYAEMRKLVPHDFADISYSPEVERDAYQHPAVTNIVPLLWVPRDPMGVSRQEVSHTNQVTPMTDEGAYFLETGKLVWDQDVMEGRAPIHEDKIYY